jgi:hypothetical protein
MSRSSVDGMSFGMVGILSKPDSSAPRYRRREVRKELTDFSGTAISYSNAVRKPEKI